MCRLMAYIGHPMLLADVVLWPDRSIIKQSYDARERKLDPTLPFHLGHGNLNGDGFGIGWFNCDDRRDKDPSPCVFTSITPAWNNENLSRLSCKIISPLIFAHVRAAYPGMPVSEQNCHPFMWGRYLWMHNGVVAGFSKIRRTLLEVLSDEAYNTIQSFHSDSAVSFAVFLHHLPDLYSQHPAEVLLKAMQDAISTISQAQQKHGITDTNLLNYVVSDGSTLVATRFVSPESEGPASLYYAEGSSFARANPDKHKPPAPPPAPAPAGKEGCGRVCTTSQVASGSSILQEASYELGYGDRGAQVAFVASEPITGQSIDWVAVPKNTALVVTREKGGYLSIMRCPIAFGRCTNLLMREVSLCLEAVSRGRAAKSAPYQRRWSGLAVDERLRGLAEDQGFWPRTSASQMDLAALGNMASRRVSLNDGMEGLVGPGVEEEQPHFSRLLGHRGPVLAVAYDDEQGRLYSASVDCTIKVWCMRAHKCLHTIQGHKKPVTALLLRPPLLYAASGRRVRAWDVHTFACLHSFKIHNNCGNIRALEMAGGTLFLACQDTTVKAFCTSNLTPQPSVTALASPNSSAWGAAAYAHPYLGHPGPCASPPPYVYPAPSLPGASAGASPSSQVPGSGTGSGTAVHRQLSASPAGSAGGAVMGRALSPSPNGHLAGTGVSPSARAPSPAPAPPSSNRVLASQLSFNPTLDGVQVPVYEVEQTQVERNPDCISDASGGHVAAVSCLAVCGDYICSAGMDAMVRVWNASDLRPVASLRGHRGSIMCLLAIDRLLLSGAKDNTIRVWDLDVAMMVCRTTLMGHTDDVTHLSAVSYNVPAPALTEAAAAPTAGSGPSVVARMARLLPCTVLASASADGTIRLWSMTWTCLAVLCQPTPVPQPSPDPSVAAALCTVLSNTLVMGGFSDGEVRVWHCENVHLAALRLVCCDLLGLDTNPGLDASSIWGQACAAGGSLTPPGLDSGQVTPSASGGIGGGGGSAADLTGLLGLLGEEDELGDGGNGNGGNGNGGGRSPRPPLPPAAASSSTSATAAMTKGGPGRSNSSLSIGNSRRSSFKRANTSDSLGAGSGRQQAATGGSGGAPRRQISDTMLPPPPPPVNTSGGGDGSSNGLSGPLLTAPSLLGPSPSFGSRRSSTGGVSLSGQGAAALLQISVSPAALRMGSATLGSGAPGLPPGAAAFAGSSASAPVASISPLAADEEEEQAEAEAEAQLVSAFSALSQHQLLQPGAGGATAGNGSGAAGSPAVLLQPEQVELVARMVERSLLMRRRRLERDCGSSSDQVMEQALREFVAIKTVSASPKLRGECLKGAKFLARLIESLGGDVKVVQPFDNKNPVVLGRLGHAPDRPTVTFYGHYDVQPALEPDWKTDPFELTAVNEHFYGRGTSDNKGPVLAFIFAVKELLDGCSSQEPNTGGGPGGAAAGAGAKGLPVNVAFIFEGEEENGSIGFHEAVMQNKRWFEGTELIVISNTLWVGENVPCLTYGMRGMICLSIEVSGPARDVHSGNDGGVFHEPMADLAKIASTLLDEEGGVRVEGFSQGVTPGLLDLAWQSLEHSHEFSVAGYQRALGVPALTAPPSKHELLEQRWCRPSLSVVDIRPGYAGTSYKFGPTRFSVIPRTAVAKISVRSVPHQESEALVGCIRAHVEREAAKLRTPNVVKVAVETRGSWWEADRSSPWLEMAKTALSKEWGMEPLFVREGGTMPVASALEKMLGAPAIMIPMGQSSDSCHLANERIRRSNLMRGKAVIRRLLEEVGGRARAARRAAAAGPSASASTSGGGAAAAAEASAAL